MTIFDITGAVGVFATYAAMTAAGSDLADNAVYCTFGRSAEEDGGFGFWRYDSASTATANDGTLLAVDGGGPGRFFRLDDGTVSPKWFGAKGDGMTNDRSDIEAADATGRGIALPSGSFLVSSNLTISSPTFFAYGAKLSIPTGVTVTLNFRPEAGLWQIFDCAGTGNVSFPQNAADEVYPEWWGVVVNSAAAASFNLTAIGKAITSGGHAVQFQCASYWISARLHVTTSHVTLRGYSRFWLAEADATRIVVNSATDDVIFVGTETEPASFIDYVTQVEVQNVELMRSSVPTPPSVGSEASAACGLRIQYTSYCAASFVRANEHSVGIRVSGTVRTIIRECEGFRQLAGSSSTNDIFWGLWFDNSPDIGLAAGNASSYVEGFTANVGGSPALTESVGIYMSSGCADCFISEPETSACDIGIRIAGTSTASQNNNCHIFQPVIDGFKARGIDIQDVSNGGVINVVSPYCAPASTATGSSYFIDDTAAAVTFVAPQAINTNNAAVRGIQITDSSRIKFLGGCVLNADKPVEMTNATDCEIAVAIQNTSGSASQAAILMTTCNRNVIHPAIVGSSGSYPTGVSLTSTGNADNDIDVAGIDPGCITGGTANVLLINSASIAADGLQ